MKHYTNINLLIASVIVSGCAVGPDYVRPSVNVPASYKEASSFAGWKVAEPKDHLSAEAWWKIYDDAQLDGLQLQAAAANQNIRVAEANFRRAQALSDSADAAFYPTLSANASGVRSKRSSNAATTAVGSRPGVVKSDVLDLPVSWEIDLWGRLRRGAESADATLAASADDLAAALLSLQATVAQDYFQLRVLDTQQKLLDDTVSAYERSLTMTSNRYAVGLASRSDVAQAEAQFRTARAQSIDNKIQRTQLEHALAVLTGQSPAQFSLAAAPFDDGWVLKLPPIPGSLPSELLERRPDIVAAERRVAAANASIGVAKAALFPTLSLAGSGGFQSTTMADLFTVPSRAWSLGPQLALSVFDGGLRRAQTRAAIAAYDASAATYKETVLSAFQEVEDNLTALSLLEQEILEQEAAVRLSRESAQQFLNRYQAGTVDYLSVVTVQTTVLTNERAALSLLGRRLTASVGLVKALGGTSFVLLDSEKSRNDFKK